MTVLSKEQNQGLGRWNDMDVRDGVVGEDRETKKDDELLNRRKGKNLAKQSH